MTAADYLELVTIALGRSPGIDDIAVDLPDDDAHQRVVVEPDDADEDDNEPFPLPGLSSLSFAVHIPLRLQRELVRESGAGAVDAETEDFRVYINAGWLMPCAAVELLGAARDAAPSTGVQVVREFLRAELRRGGELGMRFGFLGPSPAHADFYLQACERPAGETNHFWPLNFSRPAYYRYDFGFDPGAFGLMRPAEAFAHETLPEIDLYYRIAENERNRLHAWLEMEDKMSALTDLQRRHGLRGLVAKNVRSARLLDDALLVLTSFERNEVMGTARLRREFAQHYAPGAAAYARELVNDRLDEVIEYPVAQARELIRVFETRRLTDRDLVMLLVSSSVGGVLGAAATLLAA